MSEPSANPCYKFTVRSASEAAGVIRERLGENARVISVRNVEATGLARFWSAPRLEIIAQAASAPSAPDTQEMPSGPVAPDTNTSSPVPVRFAPPRSDLRTLLLRAGLSDRVLALLAQSPAWNELRKRPLHEGLIETGRHLSRLGEARFAGEPLSRAAFIGLPGSGRTTALCKWLALETFRRGRTGHVITVEFGRPNPAGSLPVLGEALGVPVVHYPAETQPLNAGGFVYFDLPGLSLRDPADNAPLAEFLAGHDITQRVLVLNAAYEPGILRRACAAGCDLGATHVMFTHLDEVERWGRLWDYVLDSGLEPLLLTTGPALTGDCEDQVLDALVRRTLPATDEPEEEEVGTAA